MSEPRTLIFEIHRDGEPVRTERLQLDVIKVGSHPKSHLFIDDPGVSRVHAAIETTSEGTFITDLGSGRGTFVNGEKVNRRQLRHLDRVRLGATDVVLREFEEVAAPVKVERPKIFDEAVYARRFLSRPASTDGSVEIAMLYRDLVIADEIYQPPRKIVIGNSKEADFAVESDALGGEDFVLVEVAGNEPVLRVTRRMEGEIYVGTERFTVAEAFGAGRLRGNGNIGEISLTAETRARINIGEQSFFVHRSTQPKVILPFFRGGAAQFAMLIYVALSTALHMSLLLASMFRGSYGGDLDMDSFGADNRFVQLLIEDPVVEEPPPEPEEAEVEEEEEQAAEGEQAAEEEGRAGDERVEEEDGRMAVEGDNPTDQAPELARTVAAEEVRDRGALSVLYQQGPTSLFGDTASGYDAITTMGGIDGDSVGASYGTRGLGRYGGGLGGGGRSMSGGFGGGPIAVSGRAGGNTDLGREQLQVTEREARPPVVEIGSAEIRGQLDRDIIQRVVREHRRELTACYEGELQRNPALEGTVSVEWVIAPDGSVAASQVDTSTLNSDAVESCITRRIRNWRFPEPRGGGTVRVTYPFVFSPGG
jgi:TonB family protein